MRTYSVSGTAREGLARWRGHNRGHLSNHGQNQAFVALGKCGAVFLDFGEKPNFVFGKFSQHFLRVAVARRLRAGKEVGESDLHRLRDFREGLQRRHGVAVLDAGKIAAQQPRSPLDIALRETSLAAITPNYFANIDLGLFFWHSIHTLPISRLYYAVERRHARGFLLKLSCRAPHCLNDFNLITTSYDKNAYLGEFRVEPAPGTVNDCSMRKSSRVSLGT